MATIRSCNKHNMIACVEKTAQNADFYQVIDFLTGCSINYSLLVDPDIIGPWLQQFWATATLQVINDVPHIRAKVAGKKILISEATIRADLLFDDENGVDCFPKQVIWDTLRDIGYEALSQGTYYASVHRYCFSTRWLLYILMLERKSDGTLKKLILRRKKLNTQERLTAFLVPYNLQPQATQGTVYSRALETTNDEEVARKIQAEWDAEEERKRFEELKKTKPKTTLRKPTSLAQERNQMMNFLKVCQLLGDLNIIWLEGLSQVMRLLEGSKKWENHTWRFHESFRSSNTLEIEMAIDYNAGEGGEILYQRELYDKDAGTWNEVENESEPAITLIHLFILWTTAEW
ncbi:hypothetical protein Tco_0420404 [Tanacetum coccineum]